MRKNVGQRTPKKGSTMTEMNDPEDENNDVNEP